jgi:hypothetical protein
VGTTGPILSGQYMTPRLLVSSMLNNIATDLANFLQHHNSILLKTSALAVTALDLMLPGQLDWTA